MNSINIITHCWALHLPQYATMLRCQLASIVHHQPSCKVTVHVCYAAADHLTRDVIALATLWQTTTFRVVGYEMPPEKLMRRGIGRNELALANTADVVWFTDCDYMFGEGCLDTLAATPNPKTLSYPLFTLSHAAADEGQAYITAVDRMGDDACPEIVKEGFVQFKNTKAFGGIMIVNKFAARMGFARDDMARRGPVKDGEWPRTYCDVLARRAWGCYRGAKIILPELYRISHVVHGHLHRDHG